MTWNFAWEGRATDFIPDNLQTTGKPGAVASAAKDALWESVQAIGNRSSSAYVRIQANGWEDADKPGLGRFSLSVDVLEEPSTITERIRAQRPVDLRQ